MIYNETYKGEIMFKLTSSKRRQERVWKILKEINPELTREKFDAAYDSVNTTIDLLVKIEK
jgi:hypothetical protein